MAVRLLTSEVEETYMYKAALSQVCGESHVHRSAIHDREAPVTKQFP